MERKRQKAISEEELPNFSHEVLPFVEMKISDLEVISRLRSLNNVRYIEPLGYEVDFQKYAENERYSNSGCSNEANNNLAGLYTDIQVQKCHGIIRKWA
jgi:hypothetical protein